jgi:Tat protein secretion system quality control protein TatD with DNase activity
MLGCYNEMENSEKLNALYTKSLQTYIKLCFHSYSVEQPYLKCLHNREIQVSTKSCSYFRHLLHNDQK